MADNKKHHYVPKFYLKLFSVDEGSISLINLKKSIVIKHAPIKGQCYKSYMYGKENMVEKKLSVIESVASGIIKNIITTKTVPHFPAKDHHALLTFILLQYGRTVSAGKEMEMFSEQMVKHLMGPEMLSKGITKEELDKIGIKLNKPELHFLSYVISEYPLIMDLKALLLVNNTKAEFITSDNPVVLYNQYLEKRTFASNTGLQSVGLQILYPLNPKNTLILYDKGVYKTSKKNALLIEIDDVLEITKLNELQIMNAEENIYCSQSYLSNTLVNFINIKKRKRCDKKVNKIVQALPPKKPDEKRELFGQYKDDLRINYIPSFLKVVKKAKRKRSEVMKQIYVRDPVLCDIHDEYRKLVKDGKVVSGRFVEYLATRANN